MLLSLAKNFKTLVKDIARKFSVRLSTLLLPLNTLNNELTNSTPNQIQGQVLGNKLKKNLVDLQATNNKLNQDIMAFQKAVRSLQVSQHAPSAGALGLLGGTSQQALQAPGIQQFSTAFPSGPKFGNSVSRTHRSGFQGMGAHQNPSSFNLAGFSFGSTQGSNFGGAPLGSNIGERQQKFGDNPTLGVNFTGLGSRTNIQTLDNQVENQENLVNKLRKELDKFRRERGEETS